MIRIHKTLASFIKETIIAWSLIKWNISIFIYMVEILHQVWDVSNHNFFLPTRCATKITNLSYSFTITHKQNSEATKPFSFDRIFHQGFLSCCISCWCSTAGSSYPAATQCRKINAEEKTEVKLNRRRIRKQQPTLCRPAIQCKNPAATECRKTSAEEKTAVKLKPTETISNIDGMR